MIPRLAILSSVLILLSSLAHAAPLSGTKSVGPTGNYSSLTAANSGNTVTNCNVFNFYSAGWEASARGANT